MFRKIRQSFADNPLVYAVLAVVILIVFAALVLLLNGNTTPKPKEGTDLPTYNSGAFMVYNKAPYLPLKSASSNSLLRDDLSYFARSTYPKVYGSQSQTAVVFNIAPSPILNGNTITFSGSFDKIDASFSVKVEQLNNEMIKTSIINTKTKYNSDSSLPSNSKKNQFIGGLPHVTTNYDMSYSTDQEKIIIYLASNSETFQKEALDYIKEAIGDDFIDDSYITIFYPDIAPDSPRIDYKQKPINP